MRLILGLILLLVAEVGIRTMNSATEPLPAELPQRPLQEIPTQLGTWAGRDLPLDPKIFERTGSATMLNRSYTNPIGDEIGVNIGIWTDPQVGFPHKPEECYPGAGWEIVDRKTLSIPSGESNIPARLLTLDKSGQRIYVLFWAECANQVLLDDGGMRVVRQTLRGQKVMSRVVKVMLQSGHSDRAVAEKQLLAFASLLLPELVPYK